MFPSLDKMNKRKKNVLTLKQKVDIVQRIQNGMKQKDLIKELGLPRSTVSSLWQKRKDILERVKSGHIKGSRKRLQQSRHPQLESKLLRWFEELRSLNVTLNGPLLKAKAIELAKEMNIDSFSCSEGWLSRFKGRHGINFRSGSVEVDVIQTECNENWNKDLLFHIKNYEARNVFSLGETCLFYMADPSKCFQLSGEECPNGIRSKERVTILVGVNMDCSEKLPLFVIGNLKNPSCFTGVNSLPTMYKANDEAWMTADFFEIYVRELEKRFRREKRQVLVFIENCTAHISHVSGLKAVKLMFFPTNLSSVPQPMDQGIIKSLKLHYRCILLGQLINAQESSKTFDVSVLQAMEWIHRSWLLVSTATIVNCFIYSGFSKGLDTSTDESAGDLAILQTLLNAAASAGCEIPPEVTADNFVSFDDNVVVSAAVLSKETKVKEEINSENDEEMTVPTPRVLEVQIMLRAVRKFYQTTVDVPEITLDHLAHLENDIERRMQMKQITDFSEHCCSQFSSDYS